MKRHLIFLALSALILSTGLCQTEVVKKSPETNLVTEALGIPAGKVVYVDSVDGSDSEGTRGTTLAFATLTAAKTAAASGDTIVVGPGVYNESKLEKNGVNWYLLPGASIEFTSTATSVDTWIFGDASGAMTYQVVGFGDITMEDSGSTTADNYCAVLIQSPASNISIKTTGRIGAEAFMGIIAGAFMTTTATGATLTVEAAELYGDYSGLVANAGTVKAVCDFRSTGSTGHALDALIDSTVHARGNVFGQIELEEGTLVLHGDVTGEFSDAGSGNARIYGNLTSATTAHNFRSTIFVQGDISGNASGGAVLIQGGKFRHRGKITNVHATGPAVTVSGGGIPIFESSVLVTQSGSSVSVDAATAQSVKIYSAAANKDLDADITPLTGALVLDADVE